MKKGFLLPFLILSLLASAQQRNTLLEASFWKATPDLNTVKTEIDKGNDPTELDRNSFDPVVLAINNNAPNEVIRYLIERRGNSIAKFTHDGRIYIHWAAYKGNLEMVHYLLEKGSDISLEDSHGLSPIAFAASNGLNNLAVYDAFFEAGIDPKKTYVNGANLLLLAMPHDKELRLAAYFAKKGLSLQDTDADGNTAFDYACRTGNLGLLKMLRQKGVKPTDNALIMAAQGARRFSNTIDVYTYLVDEVKLNATVTGKNGETVLHLLVRKPDQAGIVGYFLEKGVDVNAADRDGNTVLMQAAAGKETGYADMIFLHIKDINATNQKGRSALTMAVENGSPDMAGWLLGKGADPNVTDKDGNSLAYYLIQSYKAGQDDFEAKRILLQQKGVDFSAPQKDGNTLYHLAVAKNELDLLKKLEGLSLDVNARNDEGMTALHRAAMVSKDDAILKYLVGIGAHTDIRTEFDETAYSLALENEFFAKNPASVAFLKS